MALKNAVGGLGGLVFVAGSLLLLWFIILGAVTNSTPLTKTWFLRADTDGITGSGSVTTWNYFYFCDANSQNCGKARPAPAFGKAWASHASHVPQGLGGSHGGHTTSTYYFYMWRFGWVILLMTLFFLTLTLFTGFLACFGRLGSAVSGFAATWSLFWHTVASSLTTVTFVKARDEFHHAGRDASIGRYAFGFLWASWAALLIANVLFFLGLGRRTKTVEPRRRDRGALRGKFFPFGRKHSTLGDSKDGYN